MGMHRHDGKKNLAPHIKEMVKFVFLSLMLFCVLNWLVERHLSFWYHRVQYGCFFRYYHYITSSNYFCYTNLFLGCSNHSCFCLVNVFLYSATFISLYLVCPATHSILGSQQRRSVSHRAQKRRQKGAQKLGPAATLRMDCRPKGLLKWTKSYWNNGVCVCGLMLT